MPPLRQAGSFGVRSIIAPPVVLGILSEKMPLGPSTAAMMSFSGKMLEGLGPVDGRHLRSEVEHLRGLDEVGLRCVFREHGADLILLAVEPVDEEHLHGAAAIPVALLVVGADLADACAEALRDDGGQGLVAERCCCELPLCGGGAADETDLAARPGLRCHPVELVVGVGERRAENVVVAFGEEVAALVHLDEDVAAFDRFEFGGHVPVAAEADVPEVEVVGRAAEDDGIFLAGVLRPIDVGGHARAVLHRHHHFAIDDGDVFELLLDGLALFDEGFGLLGCELLARALGECGNGDGAGECYCGETTASGEAEAHERWMLPDFYVMQAYQSCPIQVAATMSADDSIRPFIATDFLPKKGEHMGLSRRDFVQGAVAGVALTAAPGTAFAAYGDDTDKQAVLQQIPKMHAENVKRLQEWIALPSIAAENRNFPQGPEHMAQAGAGRGFQRREAGADFGQAGCVRKDRCRREDYGGDLFHVRRQAICAGGVELAAA